MRRKFFKKKVPFFQGATHSLGMSATVATSIPGQTWTSLGVPGSVPDVGRDRALQLLAAIAVTNTAATSSSWSSEHTKVPEESQPAWRFLSKKDGLETVGERMSNYLRALGFVTSVAAVCSRTAAAQTSTTYTASWSS